MDGCEDFGRNVGEESLAVVFTDEVGEFVVPAVDFVCTDETPFADVYPLVRLVHALVGEGIAMDDILGQDISGGLDAAVLTPGAEEGPVLLREAVQEAFPAGGGIIGQDFDAVDAGDSPDGIVLVLELGVLSGFDAGDANGEFAPENLDEEVAVAASGFQETGVNPFRLRLHKVEHRVHFAGIREYLAVSRHPLLGLDLGVHSALLLGDCVLFGTRYPTATKKA